MVNKMHTATLEWVTPNAEQRIVDIARVSTNKPKGTPGNELLKYCLNKAHWSPFEMVDMCVEINTTRDISHQIIRHRTFYFQEFSQRYSAVEAQEPVLKTLRAQHSTNRQLSVEVNSIGDNITSEEWEWDQHFVWSQAYSTYKQALEDGVAKEVARSLLPEGLTPTRLFMKGPVRNWIHYIQARTYEGTQKEHRQVAEAIKDVFKENFPTLSSVLYKD